MEAYTREQRCTPTLSLTSALDGGSWSTSCRETPGKNCTGDSVGLEAGLYGYKHLVPMWFESRTVQGVASGYTEYAIRPACSQQEKGGSTKASE